VIVGRIVELLEGVEAAREIGAEIWWIVVSD